MDKQVKTINVDELWTRTGNVSCCTEYVYYAKIKRKYLNYINDNIENLSEDFVNSKLFSDSKTLNERRIHYIVKSVDKFDVHDLKKLLDEDYSIIDFLNKVYAIRERNTNLLIKRNGDKSQTK
jgi:hypothetical protein